MIHRNQKLFNRILVFLIFSILCLSCNKEETTYPTSTGPAKYPVLRWDANDDIIIEEDLYIDSVYFIINPGVNVKIKSGVNIYLGDKYPIELTVKGAENNPINFITYNPDGDPNTSFWGSIIIRRVFDSLVSPTFEYCNFIKGGGEGSDAVIVNKSSKLSFKNCLIDYSMNHGILNDHYGGFNHFTGNTIKHTLNHPISISFNYLRTIGKNNNIIADSLNHGIYLTGESMGGGSSDTVSWYAQTVPFIVPAGFSANTSSDNKLILKLEKGSILSMGKNASFVMSENTQLLAIGSAEEPIIFTSNNLDPNPGDWKRISFSYGSSAVLKNCIFEYGGLYEESMVDNGMFRLYSAIDISVEECIFRHSESTAIKLYKSASNRPYPIFTKFAHNQFTDLSSYAITTYAQAIPTMDKSNIFNGYEINLLGSTISEEYFLWKNLGADYSSSDLINIGGEPAATVEMEPGVKIKWFTSGLSVGTGKLIANGTEENPIIFTSAYENPSWGDWAGIVFGQNIIQGTILDHCEILYAGEISYSNWKASIVVRGSNTNLTIKNSTIAHSSHYGLLKSNTAEPTLENNLFFDNLEGDIITVGTK